MLLTVNVPVAAEHIRAARLAIAMTDSRLCGYAAEPGRFLRQPTLLPSRSQIMLPLRAALVQISGDRHSKGATRT